MWLGLRGAAELFATGLGTIGRWVEGSRLVFRMPMGVGDATFEGEMAVTLLSVWDGTLTTGSVSCGIVLEATSV